MYQTYSIGKMAELLGVSSESLRHYEAKGIISPQRDAESGYRYYNSWDLHMLLRARHYQSYGFTLEEIGELFRTMDLAAISNQMLGQEAEIQREILWHVNTLTRIRDSQAMLIDANNSIGVYELRERPGIYRVDTQKKYSVVNSPVERQVIKEWAALTPFTFSTALFEKNDILRGNSDFDFGMGIDEKYASFLQIEENEQVHYEPPCMCVHTCIPSRSGKYLSLDNFSGAFAYMKQDGLRLGGNLVTQVVCMAKPEQEYFNWHIAWIPIEFC